ncbi:hypothetical protein GJV85_08615 [Sulfurimonas aquatica]|uniref:Band 7 domain-containing protein n=1 Tax=Sulfurimonas aquatica TaxID=2672570 RepID=A0A975GCY1_9BACT|nr:SPFH domain-containing protein [Sulfurimonas aquatica]QSZ42171.1 hypothetical protein GJV85_08615 [Sulfurimonas aquatica]
MEFVKAKPNEYLVVAKAGNIQSLGVAGSKFIWPGQSSIMIPSTQIEAEFAMTQESKDGIALRFKGIVVYHIDKPEVAAQRFDFSNDGRAEINHLLANVSLGELRDKVSHMNMQDCINERKTTLKDAIVQELETITDTCGIAINVVQVAQVFIVEEDVRQQLEAEVRNKLRANSELSNIKTLEAIEQEDAASKLRLKRDEFEHQKERMKIDGERQELALKNKRKEMEDTLPFKLFESEQKMTLMQKKLEVYEFKEKLNLVKAKANLVEEIERNKVRKDILPLEQIPEIAGAVSKMFNGANLSFYNDQSQLMSTISPIIDRVSEALNKNK